MIPNKIQDYVKVYEDFLSPEECKQTVKHLKTVNWDKHSYYDYKADSSNSFEDDLSVSSEVFPLGLEIQNKMWFGLEKYIVKDMSFCGEWFNGWNGYSGVRFNRYDQNTRMRIHCDHIHSLFDGNLKGVPTLTILGTLNDDYDGGEFYMWGDELVELKAGSLIIFPSNFMYPHEVKPVKKGVRYSYVSWAW